MGVRIIVGREQGASRESAVLFCSTTMTAFGPVMETEEEAEAFLEWLPTDPRRYTDGQLELKYAEFSVLVRDDKADLIDAKLEELLEPRREREWRERRRMRL